MYDEDEDLDVPVLGYQTQSTPQDTLPAWLRESDNAIKKFDQKLEKVKND